MRDTFRVILRPDPDLDATEVGDVPATLPAMSPEALRAAIEGSARQAGLIVAPGLPDLLVREVENDPAPSR